MTLGVRGDWSTLQQYLKKQCSGGTAGGGRSGGPCLNRRWRKENSYLTSVMRAGAAWALETSEKPLRNGGTSTGRRVRYAALGERSLQVIIGSRHRRASLENGVNGGLSGIIAGRSVK
jgi:hypothetical protein